MSLHSYESFLSSREEWIRKERSLRRDQQDSIREISDTELAAEKRIRELRKREAKELWQDPSQNVELYPGMGFLTGKDTIHRSKLFRILKKLPKGALLHAHTDATVDADILLKLALTVGSHLMHVRVSEPLNVLNMSTVYPEFHAFVSTPTPESISFAHDLTSPDYVPSSWVPIHVARQAFRIDSLALKNDLKLSQFTHLSGPDLFDAWVISSVRLDPSEAYVTMPTVDKIWERFRRSFLTMRGIFEYEPVYRAYLREMFEGCMEDGISYIEPRLLFFNATMVRTDGSNDFTHREWILAFREVLNEFKQEAAQRGVEFIGARIIYSTLRDISVEQLGWYLDDCIQLKKEFPDEIAGFDLVGQEDQGKPLIFFAERLLQFRKTALEEGLDLPFIFHAGETLGDGSEADTNVLDALLLGTKRIGHGFSITKHPLLMQTCREKGILIEVCPVSNEILRLTSSMPMHPLPAMLNSGVPVALCCDDPAIFGNMGLTYDYFQVLVASEINGLSTLGTMALDSLLYSELPPERKEHAIQSWKAQWERFVQQIASGKI